MPHVAFPIFLVKVEGESAWPELIPERAYLAISFLKPKIGDFVVFHDQDKPGSGGRNPNNPKRVFVKKICAIKNDGYEVKSAMSWGESYFIEEKSIMGRILLLNILRQNIY